MLVKQKVVLWAFWVFCVRFGGVSLWFFFFLFFVCFNSSERFPWPLILQAEPAPNIHFSSNSLFTKTGICIRETLRRFSFFYFK